MCLRCNPCRYPHAPCPHPYSVYKPPEECKVDYYESQKAVWKWQVRRGLRSGTSRGPRLANGLVRHSCTA